MCGLNFPNRCFRYPSEQFSGSTGVTDGQSRDGVNCTQKEGRKPSEFTRYLLSDTDGNAFEVTPETHNQCPIFSRPEPVYGLLRQFVANELKSRVACDRIPQHVIYMRSHELLDYCGASEKGHYKWYPKGLLIQKLLLDYAARMAHDWGAFEIKNPLLIRGNHNAVGELMGEFHERDYRVDGGRGIGYLRYASDPLAFPFLQDIRFTRKQTPLKVYEEASCFRNEQEGEVSGLRRVRNFLMTDMHAACADVEQAREEFERLCMMFAGLMNDIIAAGRWVLGWEGTIDFYEENRDWLLGMGQRMGVPAFFKLMPQMSHYYAMKNEFQVITEDRSNVQVSTVQWDIKDGERFNIGYVDSDGGKHPCPVILHASSFGSIERTLCAILESIAFDAKQGKMPMLPLWLSPTQARVIPVSDVHLDYALSICSRLNSANIRADVDDREETVGKKIRSGETEWIPYLLVVGPRERESGIYSIRCRGEGESAGQNGTMDMEAFVQLVRGKIPAMPYRPLPLPVRVSQRPVFFG